MGGGMKKNAETCRRAEKPGSAGYFRATTGVEVIASIHIADSRRASRRQRTG